jgi:hypothetical protein
MTIEQINSSSDEELFSLLAKELETRIKVSRTSPEFLAEIRTLPVGLRAMAATYEFDVSLALDDVGWHFGNWHSRELAEETAAGLEELGAAELARVFREGYRNAQDYWRELGSEDWMDWYHGSEFEKAVEPLSREAWAILEHKKSGIFDYWVDYARRFPERVGATGG